MASTAPITGAHARAPTSTTPPVQNGDALDLFERLYGHFDSVGAVLRAASNEISPDKTIDLDVMRLIHAAEFICDRLETDFSHAIEVGYAERAN